MEPREDSAFLPLRSPFFSISKPPLNPNHISRFQTKPFSLYNTRGIDLNRSDHSFHLTSRLLGGGPATLDVFSSNPFELGFSPFYTNEGVSKDVMHGGWGQYHDDTRPPNNNNDDDDQKVLENEGDDENLTNMAYMQHDDDDDDVSKKKERRKEQEDDGEGGIIKGQWSEEEDRRLAELMEINGNKKWSSIARELKWRLGKQCRERWNNHLRPEIKKSMWSEEEDKILIEAHKELGHTVGGDHEKAAGEVGKHDQEPLERREAEALPQAKIQGHNRPQRQREPPLLQLHQKCRKTRREEEWD